MRATSQTETDLPVPLRQYGLFTFRLGVDPAALEPVRRKVQDIHRMFKQLPMPPEIATRLAQDVIVASHQATNVMEGGTLTEEEIERVLEDPKAPRKRRERRVANLRRAYERIKTYVEAHNKTEPLPITEDFIRELHQEISKGLGNHHSPGLYRNNQNPTVTGMDNQADGGVYEPPKAGAEIELLMNKFVDWLNKPPINTLPPLLRAPLTHYYFERIRPFQDGNEQLGRLLEKAVLRAAGYGQAAYYLDRYYREHRDEYRSAFSQALTQDAKKPKTCNQVFVSFVLDGLIETIEGLHQQVCQMLANTLSLSALSELLRRKEINYRQHAILDHVLRQGQSISETALKSQGWYKALYRRLSPATKSRDWKKLREEGLIAIMADEQIRPGPAFGYSYEPD